MRSMFRGIAALGVTLALAACSGSGTSNPTNAAATSGTAATTAPVASGATGGGAAPCEDATGPGTVKAQTASFAFSPANITAKVGDVITWTNSDSAPHQVGLDDNSCKMSSSFGNGQSGSLKFTVAGTFPYHCTIHPTMKGTITVS